MTDRVLSLRYRIDGDDMTDRPTAIVPNGVQPAPFTRLRKPAWIECDMPGYAGFAIFVRPTLLNGERRMLQDEANEADRYRTAWLAMDEAERAKHPDPFERQKEIVAPYVLGWNVAEYDDATGEERVMPAPATAGVAAFDYVDFSLTAWIVGTIINGHNSGKGLMSKVSVAGPSPTAGPSNGTENGPN